MSDWTAATAPTLYIDVEGVRYAYRRFGRPKGLPLLCLQHFTGTLDNWDPAIVDALAADREIILFENAGVGASGGDVPDSIEGMAAHALRFVDALKLEKLHIFGYSLGGFLAQNIAIARPGLVGRLIISGSAPEGGPGAGMDRPELWRSTPTHRCPRARSSPACSSRTRRKAVTPPPSSSPAWMPAPRIGMRRTARPWRRRS